MGVRRAQHIAECHARQHDVADIAAAAPEQARILEPRHALADRKFILRILGLLSAERCRWSCRQAGGQLVGTLLASLSSFIGAAISSCKNRSSCLTVIGLGPTPI